MTMPWRALCQGRHEQWPYRICPQYHAWTACHFKTISWVELYWLEEPCPWVHQQWPCRVPSPSFTTEQHALSRLALEYNSTDLKNSVLGDDNSNHTQYFLPVSLLNGLLFQDPLPRSLLYWPDELSILEYLNNDLPILFPSVIAKQPVLQRLSLQCNSTNSKSSVCQKALTMTVKIILPSVTAPFQYHLPSITLLTWGAQCEKPEQWPCRFSFLMSWQMVLKWQAVAYHLRTISSIT